MVTLTVTFTHGDDIIVDTSQHNIPTALNHIFEIYGVNSILNIRVSPKPIARQSSETGFTVIGLLDKS